MTYNKPREPKNTPIPCLVGKDLAANPQNRYKNGRPSGDDLRRIKFKNELNKKIRTAYAEYDIPKIDAIVANVVDQAVEGDLDCIKYVMDCRYGKMPTQIVQETQVTQIAPPSVSFDVFEALAKYVSIEALTALKSEMNEAVKNVE